MDSRHRRNWAGLLLLSMAPACAYPATSAEPVTGSLCAAPQTTYFSCQTARRRTISLCGGARQATVQYRYGRQGQVELQFPTEPAQGAQLFAFATYHRYQVERNEISFSRGDADYTLFDYTENGRRTAGVQVATASGKAAEVRCAGSIQGAIAPLGKSLRCDPDSALNGGRCP